MSLFPFAPRARGPAFAGALALGLLVSGCISVLPKAPPAAALFTLEASAPAPISGPAKPFVIAVNTPAAPRSLSGANIAWIKNSRLAFVEGASWDAGAADLLDALLIHTLDRSGAVRAGVRPGEGRADAEISWDVTNFAIYEDHALEARFAAHVNLFAAHGRALIGVLEIDERVPVAERSIRAATLSLQQAARAGAAKIAAWAGAQMSAQASEPGAARP